MIFYVRPKGWWNRLLYNLHLLPRTVRVCAVSRGRVFKPMKCKVWAAYQIRTRGAIMAHRSDGMFFEMVEADGIEKATEEMERWNKKRKKRPVRLRFA